MVPNRKLSCLSKIFIQRSTKMNAALYGGGAETALEGASSVYLLLFLN